VALLPEESVTVTVLVPAFVAEGTVNVTPLKLPLVDTAGEAGEVVTVLVPTLTDVMVVLAPKPLPVRYTDWLSATEPMAAPDVV
jgi:hypothetical protein